MKYATLLLLLITSSAFSQSKDFKINTTVDEFTGDTSIITSYFSAGWEPSEELLFSIYYDGQSLVLVGLLYSENISSVHEDDNLLIKMDDGSVITLTAISNFIGKAESLDDWSLTAMYRITEDQISQLSKGTISKVRIETSGNYYDLPPKTKKHPEEVRANFAMFYKEVLE